MSSYHILIPVDTNESRVSRQVDHVLSFPNASESVRVTLLHVYATVDGDAGTERVGGQIDEPEVIEKAQQRLVDNGIEVEYQEEEGDVTDEILLVARRLEPNVIIVAGRKRSPVGKAIFGSVSQQIILTADCAVTVVH